MIWHAPLYIPLKFFKTLESILNSFKWGNGRHKLAWQTLKNPATLRGFAHPDFQDYYLASQLSHVYYFDKTELQRYQALVSGGSDLPADTPLQAILRSDTCTRPPQYNDGMLAHHRHIWDITLQKIKNKHIHFHTSLWFNKHMLELFTIPDPMVWISNDILYSHQVMTASGPKTFQMLKDECSFPNQLLFLYLQLRHALQTQLPSDTVSIHTPSTYYIGYRTLHVNL